MEMVKKNAKMNNCVFYGPPILIKIINNKLVSSSDKK